MESLVMAPEQLRELQDKIALAKRALNNEMTMIKRNLEPTSFSLNELGVCLDVIHETERAGLRNINDVDFRRINRILTSVEARLKLHKN